MARFRENFGSLTSGVGTPTGFTALDATNAVFEVVTDGGSEGGQALEVQKSGAGRTRLTLDVMDGETQQDVVMLFEVDTTGRAPGLIINATGGAGAETEYLLEAFGTGLTLWEGVSGTYTQRATAASALGSALTSGVVYAMRLRRQVNTYYGRIWVPASEHEPAAWDVSSLDGSPRAAGGAGISYPSSAGTMTVHYLSAALDNDCGCVLPDADFPDSGIYATSDTDGSLRVYSEDAATNAVVAIFGPAALAEVRACAVHRANETVYVAKRLLGEVTRVDRYGLNATAINTTITGPYGVDIDEAAGILFISDRVAGEFYTDDLDGGNEANPLTLALASYMFWDDIEEVLWWVGNNRVYSGANDFSGSTDYGTFTAPLQAISDGTTVAVSDFDTAGPSDGIFTKPVASPGDAFTSADATGVMQGLTINGARDEAYGASNAAGTIIKWTAYPPSAANRTTLATLAGVRAVDWFEFSEPTVTASLALTDGADTIAAESSVIVSADLALTDGADVIAAELTVVEDATITASLALTDGADVVAAEVSVLVAAALTLVDGADVLAITASPLVAADLALVDGADVISMALSDPNNTIRDIEMTARPLVGITLTAKPLMQISMTARPFVQ